MHNNDAVCVSLHRGASMLAPTLQWCRCHCQPARGTRPVMTVCSPEIRSVPGTGRRVWKYLHARTGEGVDVSDCTCASLVDTDTFLMKRQSSPHRQCSVFT